MYDNVKSTQKPITSYFNDNDSSISRFTATTHSSKKSFGDSTTTLIITDSNDQILNNTTFQYAEVGFPSPHPIAPPTNDVPVQYCVICDHLNTMVIYCTNYIYTQKLFQQHSAKLIKPLFLKLVCIATTYSLRYALSLLI